MAITKEVKMVQDHEMRSALLRKPVAIRGNFEFKTWIMQTLEFYKQFELAPGVTLYPKRKSPSEPAPSLVGLLGHLAGVPIWILPEEERIPEFHVQYEFNG